MRRARRGTVALVGNASCHWSLVIGHWSHPRMCMMVAITQPSNTHSPMKSTQANMLGPSPRRSPAALCPCATGLWRPGHLHSRGPHLLLTLGHLPTVKHRHRPSTALPALPVQAAQWVARNVAAAVCEPAPQVPGNRLDPGYRPHGLTQRRRRRCAKEPEVCRTPASAGAWGRPMPSARSTAPACPRPEGHPAT